MGFTIENPSEHLTRLFTLSDDKLLSEFGCEIAHTEVHRGLVYAGKVINTRFVLPHGGTPEVHLNFHNDVSTGTAAEEKLKEQVLRTKNMGYELLERVYDLTLDAEE